VVQYLSGCAGLESKPANPRGPMSESRVDITVLICDVRIALESGHFGVSRH
jgi:hypothetical protein